MYYVIKKVQGQPLSTFIGFSVPKYIASKNSENVIFEFIKDDKPQRKWVKKDEIILLTDDKEYFYAIFEKFKKLEDEQKELVEDAKKELEKSMQNFNDTMQAKFDEFNELKNCDEIPDVLKSL